MGLLMGVLSTTLHFWVVENVMLLPFHTLCHTALLGLHLARFVLLFT